MPGYSTECQPIANKITGLKSEVASFQKELQTAAQDKNRSSWARLKS
ncbi:MAG TPA: hypothetical protein VIX90_02905 [Edaphobacter sp.]